MSSSLLVLLLFSVILFHSCEKEGNHLKDTIDQEIVIQVSNEIMKLNSVEEYKKSQIEVLQMTFEELNKSFKQRKIMNLKVALILFLTTIVSLSNAQDESKKIDLKIGFSFYEPITKSFDEFNKVPNLNVEVNCIISKFLKSGVYIGTSYVNNWKIISDNSVRKEYDSKGSLAVYYGANINFSLLQILAKAEGLKPDFYALARIGGRFIPAPEDYLARGNDFIWGGGLGISYQFNKKVGAFVESTYGNNYFDRGFDISLKEKIDFRYGIFLRF